MNKAKAQIDTFLSNYKQQDDTVYSLISGTYHLCSHTSLNALKQEMYYLVEEDEDEDEDSVFSSAFEAFGDLRLIITNNIDINKPYNININGNFYIKNLNQVIIQ